MKLFGLFAIIFAFAAGAFAYSRTLPHLTDEAGFRVGYAELQAEYERGGRDHMALSEAYFKLHEAHLTPRIPIKKYSLTIMVLTAGGMLLFCRGIRGLKTPANKWHLIFVALIGTVCTVWGGLLDINESFGRGDVPYWSNLDKGSIGILYGFTFFCALATVVNMAFIVGKEFNFQTTVFPLDIKQLPLVITGTFLSMLAITLLFAWDGSAYFSLIATPSWLYFYLCLMAIRSKGQTRFANRA